MVSTVELTDIGLQEDLASPIDRRSDYYRRQALRKVGPRNAALPEPLLTLPTILTLLRIALIPLFLVLWHIPEKYASISTALVFIVASVTDWLDGYVARKWKLMTAFGAFLDPVADKLMVTAALILLSSAPPAPISQSHMITVVTIIISREITMSSLREWAAAARNGAHEAVKVNSLGKWKTAMQMTGMSLLLLLRNGDHILGDEPRVVKWIHRLTQCAWISLICAAILAVFSLANYMKQSWQYFRYPKRN